MAAPAQKPTIDTCNECGKLFPRTAVRLCTQCVLVEENRFRLVRDYLIDNDGAPLGEISRETGISMSDVRRFTDGGRLVEVTTGLETCTCGGVGQRCRACRMRLSNSFRQMEQSMQRDHAERAQDPRAGGRDRRADEGSSRTSYVKRIRRLGE
jgi:hypothetical protein